MFASPIMQAPCSAISCCGRALDSPRGLRSYESTRLSLGGEGSLCLSSIVRPVRNGCVVITALETPCFMNELHHVGYLGRDETSLRCEYHAANALRACFSIKRISPCEAV